jgi:hypothetical protein
MEVLEVDEAMAELLDALAEADRVIEENVSMTLSEVVDALVKVSSMKVLEVDVSNSEMLDALAEAEWAVD